MSNLKQQGLALIMFAQDYEGYLLHGFASSEWRDSPENRLGLPAGQWPDVLASLGYLADEDIFFCPSSAGEPSNPDPPTASILSYVVNEEFMKASGTGAPWIPMTKLDRIQNPSGKILVIDALYVPPGNWVTTINSGWRFMLAPGTYDWDSRGRRPAQRHSEGANVLFADGHVEWRNDTWTNMDLWQ